MVLISLEKYKIIGMHWLRLYVNGESATYFNSFWSWTYYKENNKKIIWNKNIATNTNRTQANDSILC